MKRLVALMVAVAVVIGVQSAFAGAGCGKCPASKAKADKSSACVATEKLNLTAEQKTKVEALVAECQKGKCDKAAKEKIQAGMKEILTAEQYKQWEEQCKTACAKDGKSGCGLAKKTEKSS